MPDTARVEALLAVHNWIKLSDFNQAKAYADSAYSLAVTTNSSASIARSAQFHAISLSLTGRLHEAKEVLAMAIKHARIAGRKGTEAYAYLTRGNVHYDLSEFDSALTNYQESHKIYMEIDRPAGASSALIWMGIINQNILKNYANAVRIYKEASDLAEKGNSTLNKGYILSNLGGVYFELEEYDSAILTIEASNEIKRRFKDRRGLANGLELLGNSYLAKEQFSVSLPYHQESLEIREVLGDSIGLSNSYMNLGRAYGFNGELSKGLSLLKKGRDIANRIGHKENIPQSFEFESALLERSGSYKNALGSYKSYKAVSDSVFNIESTRVLEEMQVKYDTEGKEKTIALQNAELSGQEARLQRNQALIIGLIVVAVLLIVIMTLLRNRAQKEQALIRQEGELKLREAEINAVIGSQEKERNRFAKDLHDGFGQMISVLKMNLGQLGNGASKDPQKQLEVFEQSEQVIADMYNELRNICFDLMPQTLVQQGLPDALKEFGQRITNTGTKVLEVLVFDLDDRLDELMEVSLYRISQEWVNNLLKYSEADHITIQLTRDETEITLTIEDNGTGFDPQDFFSGKGNGWRNIQSRVNLIKGTFELDSRPGVKGSLVSVNAPINLKETIPTSTDEEIGARVDF
ncbi:MAG: hypothetical protein Roseis2KO_23330 [Roseivirga sp.]